MLLRYLLLLFWVLIKVDIGYSQPKCEMKGTVERPSYYADTIDTQMVYSIYLPPCYANTDDHYPVIYLMHGSNEDDGHWQRLGLIEWLDDRILSGEVPPIIVVMPFGNWIANENQFDEASWNFVFLNRLLPLVEQSYRIHANRSYRAIGGISRGGFWAFQIAFSNPALFSVVGGHSAFFDRHHAPSPHNPLDLALDGDGIDSLRIYLDHGRDDYAYQGLDLMKEHLAGRGVGLTYQVHPEGQHHNDYWSQHLDTYLEFYTSTWQENISDDNLDSLPSATPESRRINNISVSDHSVLLYLPVVAFPSLQFETSSDRLQSIRLGVLDNSFVLNENTAEALTKQNVLLPPGTRIVPDDELFNLLWRDRNLFTLLPLDHLEPRYRVLHVDGLPALNVDLTKYPFAFEAHSPNYNPSLKTSIILSGVTALTRGVIPVLDEQGIEWASGGILDYVHAADFFHMSNEVSIHPTCPVSDGVILGGDASFCSKGDHFELLELLDVDVVELSGNHNNDYGYQAYLDTLDWYRDRGISIVGGGETISQARNPFIIDHNGNTIVMLSCNWVGPYYALVNEDEGLLGGVRPGAASCDRDWLAEIIPVLAVENDIVIITVQYTEVDQYTPTPSQRHDFRLLIDLGADVVIGTQAHFSQTFEFITRPSGKQAFIHYGLGNLYFDQEFYGGVRFFMDQFIIYDGRLISIDLFPGMIEDQGRPRAMALDERENFLFLMFIQYGGF